MELFENVDLTLSVPIHSVQYYHNLVNLFMMPERCFTSLSLILGLISNLIACFQADLALLFLQAYYPNKRWRQVIISRVHNTEYSCIERAQSGYRLKIIDFKSIHRIRVDGRKRCENATCGCEFC